MEESTGVILPDNNNHNTTISETSSELLEHVDLDVQIAAEALGSLSKAVSIMSTSSNTINSIQQTRNATEDHHHNHDVDVVDTSSVAEDSHHFMQRVTNIPLVNQSLSQIGAAYEATKNYSKVVKYSAETVESGVRSISKPVLETVAPALAPLDRFACHQLDRLEKSFPTIIKQNNNLFLSPQHNYYQINNNHYTNYHDENMSHIDHQHHHRSNHNQSLETMNPNYGHSNATLVDSSSLIHNHHIDSTEEYQTKTETSVSSSKLSNFSSIDHQNNYQNNNMECGRSDYLLPECKRARTNSMGSDRSIPMSITTEFNMPSWPSSPKMSSDQSLPSTVASSPILHSVAIGHPQNSNDHHRDLSTSPSSLSSTPTMTTPSVLPHAHHSSTAGANPSVSSSAANNTSSRPLIATDQTTITTTTAPHIDRKPRSRWSQVVAGVGTNFGSMVISDEMMRGLRYCLRWLQYATSKVDRQIAVLLNYLSNLARNQNRHNTNNGVRADDTEMNYSAGHNSSQPTPPLSPYLQNQHLVASGQGNSDFMAIVQNIRNDIVETLKKVVDVIGKYAAAYLPYEARRRVKGFILALPGRWAHINASPESGNSPAAPGTPENEAQRVLSLATESSAMLKSVSSVFSQSVEGAEMVRGHSSYNYHQHQQPFSVSSSNLAPPQYHQPQEYNLNHSSAFPSVTTLIGGDEGTKPIVSAPAKYDPKDEDKMDMS